MRIVEISNKLQLPITNEEADMLDQFEEGAVVYKNELNERQQLLANQLVVKDLLLRKHQNGQIIYKKKIKA